MKKINWKGFIGIFALGFMVITLPHGAIAKNKVLKIGCNTNFRAKEGLEIKKWHDLIEKTINAQGGWKVGKDTYNLEIFTDDNGGDQAKIRSTIEKQIYRDGVKIILDNFLSDEIQTAQIAEQNQVLALGEGFRAEAAKPDFHYYYRTNGIFFARAFHYLLYRDYYNRGARTGLFITPEGPASSIQAQQYEAAMKLAGIKPLPPIFYLADTVDFGPIATKIKSQNPDMVELAGAGGSQAIDIISSLYDSGWKGLISPSSVNKSQLENIVKRVGNWFDGTELLYFDPRGIQKDPEMLEWLDRYTKEYGEFNESGCFWIQGWWVLRDAVNNTQSVDVEVLKKYLDSQSHGVMTLTGYLQLFARPDLGNYRPIDGAPGHGIGIIKNGNMAYYKQVTVKDQYLVSIKAYGMVDTYKKYWEEYGKPTFPPEESVFDFKDLD